jgi:hypothetical protein
MTRSYSWREIASPIIRETISNAGTNDMKHLRRELSKAYPFGQKKYYPYKVWLDEIKQQLGTKLKRGDVRRCNQTIDMFSIGEHL